MSTPTTATCWLSASPMDGAISAGSDVATAIPPFAASVKSANNSTSLCPSWPGGPVTVALVTVSDTRTPETDDNGIYLREQLTALGHMVAGYRIVKDEPDQVESALEQMVTTPGVQLVLFNGGTGIV